MRILIAFLFCISAVAASAENWFGLDGQGIGSILKDGQVTYENGHRQSFYADGTTEYSAGSQPSIGNWLVEGDFYCSQWPPQKDWDCYTVQLSDVPGRILFTGMGGDRYFGRLKR